MKDGYSYLSHWWVLWCGFVSLLEPVEPDPLHHYDIHVQITQIHLYFHGLVYKYKYSLRFIKVSQLSGMGDIFLVHLSLSQVTFIIRSHHTLTAFHFIFIWIAPRPDSPPFLGGQASQLTYMSTCLFYFLTFSFSLLNNKTIFMFIQHNVLCPQWSSQRPGGLGSWLISLQGET